MAYPVKAVANAILQIANEHNSQISPLKLQKLVYIAHGWHLALTDEPLVSDELPEAWQYGPVFPSLYHEFKEFGKGPINGRATDLDFADGFDFSLVEPKINENDSYVWQLLRRIWDAYGKFGAIGLSDLTHKSGTPWDQVYRASGGIKNADISNDVVRSHYKDLVNQRSANG